MNLSFVKPFEKLALGLAFAGALAMATPAQAGLLECAINALQGSASESAPASPVEVAFSPGGGGTALIQKAVASARSSIRVAAYSFTSRPIANALADAKDAGVDVAVVLDKGQVGKNSHSVLDFLVAQEIPVRIDAVHKIQHDKYMIIDGKTVQTGSFNYTAAAEHNNSENVIVLWDNPKLADIYQDNWQVLWDKADPFERKRR